MSRIRCKHGHVCPSLGHIGGSVLKGGVWKAFALDDMGLVLTLYHLPGKETGPGRGTDVSHQTAALDPILIIYAALIPSLDVGHIEGIPGFCCNFLRIGKFHLAVPDLIHLTTHLCCGQHHKVIV